MNSLTDAAGKLNSLARRLVAAGLLTASQAWAAQQAAYQAKQNFVDYLYATQGLTGELFASLIAEEFGLAYLNLAAFNPEFLPKSSVAASLLVKHQLLPLALKDGQLYLALANPSKLTGVDEVKFITGYWVQLLVVSQASLAAMLAKNVKANLPALESLTGLDSAPANPVAHLAVNDLSLHASQDEAPLVKFVNQVLAEAVRLGASDIHFEPYEDFYRIRCRIDGLLHELTRPPAEVQQRLAARIKVMAKMNLAERRIPQDGSLKLTINEQPLDFRVNTLPTLWGEKLVVRILDAKNTQLGISQLGLEAEQQALYEAALAKPQGLILVTGPTGSGKTLTLYSGLNLINTPERNISSAEDPVEINLAGINQVNINPKVGLTFAATLRAFLRQDPDVLLLGEIRDLETAEIALKAAETGHLVLASLHTNSAVESLSRLANMGLATYSLAASLQLIIAQRLARKLCPSCKLPDTTPPELLLELGFSPAEINQQQLYQAKGCQSCTLGYKGRLGIYEVVKMTPKLAEAVVQNTSATGLAKLAEQEGFYNLRAAGRKKALAGLISISELTRVTLD